MKITSLTYSRGATVNRGNFNSDRVDLSVTVEIDGTTTPEEAYDKARDWVMVRVSDHIKAANRSEE